MDNNIYYIQLSNYYQLYNFELYCVLFGFVIFLCYKLNSNINKFIIQNNINCTEKFCTKIEFENKIIKLFNEIEKNKNEISNLSICFNDLKSNITHLDNKIDNLPCFVRELNPNIERYHYEAKKTIDEIYKNRYNNLIDLNNNDNILKICFICYEGNYRHPYRGDRSLCIRFNINDLFLFDFLLIRFENYCISTIDKDSKFNNFLNEKFYKSLNYIKNIKKIILSFNETINFDMKLINFTNIVCEILNKFIKLENLAITIPDFQHSIDCNVNNDFQRYYIVLDQMELLSNVFKNNKSLKKISLNSIENYDNLKSIYNYCTKNNIELEMPKYYILTDNTTGHIIPNKIPENIISML